MASRLRLLATAAGLLVAACSGSGTEQAPASTVAETGDEASVADDPGSAAAGSDNTVPAGTDDTVLAGVELLPDSAVGEAFGGLLTASIDGTLSEAIVEDSLSEVFLEQIDAATFVRTAQQLPALLGRSPVVVELQTRTEYHLAGTLLNPTDGSRWSFVAGVEVDPPHRMLTFGIAQPQPPAGDASIASIDEARAAWADLGSSSQLLIEEIDPASTGTECATGGDGLAIGSAFKFYVLGAVASAVETGELAWSDEVVIDDHYRSLPSGQLQVEPAGATLSVVEAAELMMGISDNTATDHLIALVGREAVEAQLQALANTAAERNRPLVTTAELFRLKLGDPIGLGLYAAADEAGRRRMLDTLASQPLPEPAPGDFETPTAIDVEWFASTADLCRAVIGLEQRGRAQPEILRALRAGRGLPLTPEVWPVVDFKGGSEPGVLSLTWLVERADDRRFVVSGIANDPETDIDQARALSIMTRVFELLGEE